MDRHVLLRLIVTGFIIFIWFNIAAGIGIMAQSFDYYAESILSKYLLFLGFVFAGIIGVLFYRFYSNVSLPWFSINILFLSTLIGSFALYYSTPSSPSAYQVFQDPIPQLFYLDAPAKLTIFLMNKIPGYFPLYNESYAVGLLKDFFLTFLTIALIYAPLIAIKLLATKLFSLAQEKYQQSNPS